jgi:Zn-finger protein
MPDSFIEYYNLGGYWLDRSRHGLPRVWACEKCNMNHDKEVADFYEIHKESRSVDWL